MENQTLNYSKDQSWQMFDRISSRYDLVNRLMTFGCDVSWRSLLRGKLPQTLNQVILDVATGTGDVVIALTENNPSIQMAYGIDKALKMLEIGRHKVSRKNLSQKIMLQEGDAQSLQFMDNTFDAVTIAFGIRNIPDYQKALTEIYRVLKPGGKVLILETAIPENPLFKIGHSIHTGYFIPLIGLFITGNYQAYKYLNQTIKTFPYGKSFCRILTETGFQNVGLQPLLAGASMIYEGEKQ